jgi:hypothetical protein
VPDPFQYLVLRVVPRVEREEFINAGVVVFCRAQGFLAAEVGLDRPTLAALAPDADAEAIGHALRGLAAVAAGAPEAGALAALDASERFHWLAAPSSTVIQRSSVHSGLCADPAATLRRLFTGIVSR